MTRVGAIAVVALLAACNNKSRSAITEASGSGSGSGSSAEVVRRFSAVEHPLMRAPPIEIPKQEAFVLVDPGEGKRAPLRYAFVEGTTESHVETKLVSRQLDKGTFSDPVKIPAIRDGFAVRILPDHAPLALRALEATLEAPSRFGEQYLSAWRTQLQNRRVAVAVDPRGRISTITFNDDPGNQRSAHAKDELVQRLLATIVPLPDEPIGIGAKWKVITILRQGPAYIKQTADYRLVARTPARWRIAVKLLRVGEQQIVVDPALPPDTRAELIALFRLLEGTLEVDPTRPFAVGKLGVESRMHARVTVPRQPPVEQLVEDTGSITMSTVTP